MILKSADDRDTDLATLQTLLDHPDATAITRRKIEREMRNIRQGATSESDAAYHINFNFRQATDWAVIHDLRIETQHRVAQIDHLLINRLLDVWVCETKRFSGGLAINEYGECTTFLKGNRPQAIASPIEQNRNHCSLLQALFDDPEFPLPQRAGFRIRPNIRSAILISPRTRFTRPKTKIDGIESIIKSDQVKTYIDKNFEDNPLMLAKLVSSTRLMELGEFLVGLHCPKRFNWYGKFALAEVT
jgi:Nuclease-related domain